MRNTDSLYIRGIPEEIREAVKLRAQNSGSTLQTAVAALCAGYLAGEYTPNLGKPIRWVIPPEMREAIALRQAATAQRAAVRSQLRKIRIVYRQPRGSKRPPSTALYTPPLRVI
jgi:hypothetical protein